MGNSLRRERLLAPTALGVAAATVPTAADTVTVAVAVAVAAAAGGGGGCAGGARWWRQ